MALRHPRGRTPTLGTSVLIQQAKPNELDMFSVIWSDLSKNLIKTIKKIMSHAATKTKREVQFSTKSLTIDQAIIRDPHSDAYIIGQPSDYFCYGVNCLTLSY